MKEVTLRHGPKDGQRVPISPGQTGIYLPTVNGYSEPHRHVYLPAGDEYQYAGLWPLADIERNVR